MIRIILFLFLLVLFGCKKEEAETFAIEYSEYDCGQIPFMEGSILELQVASSSYPEKYQLLMVLAEERKLEFDFFRQQIQALASEKTVSQEYLFCLRQAVIHEEIALQNQILEVYEEFVLLSKDGKLK